MHHQFRLPPAPYRYRMEGLLSHRLPFFIGTSERAPGSKDAGEADPRHSIPLSPNSQKIIMIGLLVDNDPYNITIAWSFGKEMKYV